MPAQDTVALEQGNEEALWQLLSSLYGPLDSDLGLYTCACPFCPGDGLHMGHEGSAVLKRKLCYHILEHHVEPDRDKSEARRLVWAFVFCACSALGRGFPACAGGKLFFEVTAKRKDFSSFYTHFNLFRPFLPKSLGGPLSVKDSVDKLFSRASAANHPVEKALMLFKNGGQPMERTSLEQTTALPERKSKRLEEMDEEVSAPRRDSKRSRTSLDSIHPNGVGISPPLMNGLSTPLPASQTSLLGMTLDLVETVSLRNRSLEERLISLEESFSEEKKKIRKLVTDGVKMGEHIQAIQRKNHDVNEKIRTLEYENREIRSMLDTEQQASAMVLHLLNERERESVFASQSVHGSGSSRTRTR